MASVPPVQYSRWEREQKQTKKLMHMNHVNALSSSRETHMACHTNAVFENRFPRPQRALPWLIAAGFADIYWYLPKSPHSQGPHFAVETWNNYVLETEKAKKVQRKLMKKL